MKAFILTYSSMLDIGYVHNVLNSSQSVETWISPFPYSAIVISKLTVSELSAVLHSHFGENWFIVIEASQHNSNGWLTKEFWDYIAEPQTAVARKVWSQLALQNLPPPANRLAGK